MPKSIPLFFEQIWNRVLADREVASLASCRSFEQGNVISWAESVKLWNTSHVELRSGAAAIGDEEDIMSTPFAKNSPFCATHKARLTTIDYSSFQHFMRSRCAKIMN